VKLLFSSIISSASQLIEN